jgi:hypothetical protein
MDHTKVELAHVESAVSEAVEGSLHELNELQLAFVGGGAGDVTLS